MDVLPPRFLLLCLAVFPCSPVFQRVSLKLRLCLTSLFLLFVPFQLEKTKLAPLFYLDAALKTFIVSISPPETCLMYERVVSTASLSCVSLIPGAPYPTVSTFLVFSVIFVWSESL